MYTLFFANTSMDQQRVTIEKLVAGGQGMGRVDNKVVFVWGGLPGEVVDFQIIKKKKQFIEGVMTAVVTPSPSRIEPRDAHYLICSPWQSMRFDEENIWKKAAAIEAYQRLGNVVVPAYTEIFSDGVEYGYRNKLEFSFTTDAEGKVSLGFHERGSLWRSAAVTGCALGTSAINATAEKIVAWLRQQAVSPLALKSVVIRSNTKGETVAALFIKDRIVVTKYPERNSHWLGFQIFYSNPLSPASVPTESIYNDGPTFLTESVNGRKLKYGSLSFFQVNVPVFRQAITDIGTFIDPGSSVVDYYSGVGSIGLPLADKCAKLTLVESNPEAVQYANSNITANNISNAKALLAAAENDTSHITHDSIIILDPPRIGLHKKVIEALLEIKPRRIVYLSCDIATHARDIALLSVGYKPAHWKLYNFFPRTPHTESLVVMDRIG